MAIFSKGEVERRHEALRERLGESDAGVAFSFANSYYLSGVPIIPWGRPAVVALPKDSPPVFIVAAQEEERVRQHSPVSDVRIYGDMEGPNLASMVRLLAGFLKERGLRSVGFDANGASVAALERLKKVLPGVDFRDISDVLEDMRLVYSDEEITLMRTASEIADVGMESYINSAKIGDAEVVLAGRTMLAMSEYAAQQFPEVETRVNCYSQQGLRSLQPHTGTSGERLRPGELLTVVIEVYAWNYQVAVERAMLTGEPSTEQRRYCEAMLEAQAKTIDAIKPGARFSEIDATARMVLEAAGYNQIPCGSGLARGLITEWEGRIDAGNLRTYNDRVLEPNMILSVEPWAIVPGVGGSRHCDMVLVSDSGHEQMTKAQSGIIKIG